MARLHTEKEKYGVSVAARIDPELAHQISDRAERLGISYTKMVSLLISRAFSPQEPIRVENREEIARMEMEYSNVSAALETLQNADEANRQAIARFIDSISKDPQEQQQHIINFKTIRDELRGELSES